MLLGATLKLKLISALAGNAITLETEK
jgi:hypothetical protein